MPHTSQSARIRPFPATRTPHPVVPITPMGAFPLLPGAHVPSVVLSAPAFFRRCGYSLEKMRQAWGIRRCEAQELVLAGLVEMQIGESRGSERRAA